MSLLVARCLLLVAHILAAALRRVSGTPGEVFGYNVFGFTSITGLTVGGL